MRGLVLKETSVEVDSDGVCTVWLDRPKRGNAYTFAMADELEKIFVEVNRDNSVHVVVLAGRGSRFCVGADLGATSVPESVTRDLGGVSSLAIFNCKKPVIAALHGAAVGIGITMVLPCDIRVAEEDCKIGFIFANRGLSVEACSSFFLPRLVGNGKAFEYCMLAKKFDAREEASSGLFTKVVPKGQAYEVAKSLARDMIKNSSKISLAYIKRCLWHGNFVSHPYQTHDLESKVIRQCFVSEDAVEGFQSFLEKREAHFKGVMNDAAPDLDLWSNWSYKYTAKL